MVTMPPPIRTLGRNAKRMRLKWLRDHSDERIRYNTELNWREIWHQCTRLESTPREIQIGTNWTCNLSCFFCRRETVDKEKMQTLPRNELQIPDRVMEELAPVLPYAEVVTLTPLGEPLMYLGLDPFLEKYKATGAKNLQLTTNANILSDKMAHKLVDAGLNRMYVSIDSAEPEMYAELRTGGKLEKVDEGIRNMNKWKQMLKQESPEIILASTFMRRNIGHLPGLIEFAHGHGIKAISVQMMEDEEAGIEAETLGHHVPYTIEVLKESQRLAEERGVKLMIHLALKMVLSAHSNEAGVTDFLDSDPLVDMRGKTLIEKCHYPFSFMIVDTDGDVRPCCWVGQSFGNLSQKSFDEVWNGPGALKMREHFHGNFIPASCRGKHCRVDIDE